MAKWKYLPTDKPTDTEVVWIRLDPYWSQPFLATWKLGTQTFVTVANNWTLPWYLVSRWRSQ